MQRLATILLATVSAIGFSACASKTPLRSRYDAVAYRPNNPNNVRIKVSLQNRAVYVMEGDRPLLVTATAVGTPSHPTPTGNFRIFSKIPKSGWGPYGLSVSGDSLPPCKSSEATGRYVGFPMAYWCEFAPAYGFHEGSV